MKRRATSSCYVLVKLSWNTDFGDWGEIPPEEIVGDAVRDDVAETVGVQAVSLIEDPLSMHGSATYTPTSITEPIATAVR